MLGALVRNTREAADGPLIKLSQREMTVGNPLTATLRGAADSSILLDLFRPGDTVEHLPVQAAAWGRRTCGYRSIPREPQEPAPRVLVCDRQLGAAEPGCPPQTERTSGYLAVLREALRTATGARADLALFEVRPAPVPAIAVVKPPAAPSRQL